MTPRNSHLEVRFDLHGLHYRFSASKKSAIWVIVDRLTKSAHFLPIRDTWGVEKLARFYVKEIVRLPVIPLDIVSDKDPRLQAHFW